MPPRARRSGTTPLAAIGFLTAVVGFAVAGPGVYRTLVTAPHTATAVAAGDTVIAFGPRQYLANGSSKGSTFVDRFTVTIAPGKIYSLKLVNGAADGTGRSSSAKVVLNGFQVIASSEVTQQTAQLEKVIALREVDTLALTLTGNNGTFVTLTVLGTPDSSYNILGPATYAITSGNSFSTSFQFAKPAATAPPYRLFVTNGASDGTKRVTSSTVTVNGVSVSLGSSVGSALTAVPLTNGLTNAFSVTMRGSVSSFLTVRVTGVDTTHPGLAISAPAPGLVTNQSAVTASGTLQSASPVTVAINGASATVTGNASWSGTATLPAEGSNLLSIVATNASGRHTDSTRSVIRDTQTPALALSSPADGSSTRGATATVSGTVVDATTVTVNANGIPLTVAGGAFSGTVPLIVGINLLTTTATDAAGNASSVVRTVTRDTLPPILTVSAPTEGAVTTADSIAVAGTVTDASPVTLTINGVVVTPGGGGAFSRTVGLTVGLNTFQVIAQDPAGNSTSLLRAMTREGDATPPPDPATTAPPVDLTVGSIVPATTAFLYTGPGAIQTGMVPGSIVQARVSVLQGKVLDRTGAPLSGVMVTALGHPELGQTVSRTDGRYDFAANGGDLVVLNFARSGFLPAQRQVAAPWQDYAPVDSVALVQVDSVVTTVVPADTVQVARGSVVQDTNGVRQATVLFPPNTQGTALLPDGSTQPLSSMHVRATEFTVGAMGPAMMPAQLPPASGYTYATEISVDEALAVGALHVTFNQPVPFYLENFLHFKVGTAVPVGTYDRAQGKWIPEPDGTVINLVGVSGGLAVISIDSAGTPATADQLGALGFTDNERARLATLYPVGQELWRTRHTSFSPKDWNWPWGPPPGAEHPGGDGPQKENQCECPTEKKSSVIGVETQSLGEVLPVAGTPFTLTYRSERTPGYRVSSVLRIPLTDASPPLDLKAVALWIRGGTFFEPLRLPAGPNEHYIYSWDGKDSFGRVVQGLQPYEVQVGYVYDAVYGASINGFGTPGIDLDRVGGNGNDPPEVILWTHWTGLMGNWDARGQGLGGWTLNVHHAYSIADRTLYLGTGERRPTATIGNEIAVAAGTTIGFSGDGGPATAAQLSGPNAVATGPDGSLYISDANNYRIRRVDPDGVITTVIGTGEAGYNGDDIPAVQAQISMVRGMAVAPDGALYFADAALNWVRKITPDGYVRAVAGTGVRGSLGDRGPAIAAQLFFPYDLALGPDGSLYIADAGNNRIRRVSPAGIITTFAGTGVAGNTGNGGPAIAAGLYNPQGVEVSREGEVYILSSTTVGGAVRRVGVDGIIRVVVDGSTFNFTEDGHPVLLTALKPDAIALGPDGTLYLAEGGGSLRGYRVSRVLANGIVTTAAGDGKRACGRSAGTCFIDPADGNLAVRGHLYGPQSLAFGPDGTLYIADQNGDRIRRIAPPLPGLQRTDMLVPSEDGSEVYRFDVAGRHLRTLDAQTGATRYSFAYDATGRLQSVTDAFSNVTTIERDGAGLPTAIVGPFGQRTVLSTSGAGWLTSVSNPAGERVVLSSRSAGLLDSLIDPRGKVHRFSYDSLGRLLQDSDPAGGALTLAFTGLDTTYTVAVTTALNRTSRHQLDRLSNASVRRISFDEAGLSSTALEFSNDSTVRTSPDGTQLTSVTQGDPRWGAVAPAARSLSVRAPSGLILAVRMNRILTGGVSGDPFQYTAIIDTLVVNGRAGVLQYDRAARSVTATTPSGRQSTTVLDTVGRVVQSQAPGFVSVSFAYDARGRLSQVQSGGRISTFGYDASGRLKSSTDPLGRSDTLFYDTADRLVRRKLPGNREIRFAYDSSGNLVGITPPGRPEHRFSYTSVDLSDGYTPPSVGAGSWGTSYSYNADKQVTSVTRPDGGTIGLGYDLAGRPQTVTFDRGTLALGYSPTTGQLASLTAPGGAGLSYTYDGFLPTTATWTGPVAGSVGLTYDSDFRVSTLAVNGANAVSYGYDGDGLLTQAGALGIKRDAVTGLLARDSVGSAKGAWSFDNRGALSGYASTVAGSTLFQTAYTRDSLSRITQLVETAQGVTTTWGYEYDEAGRLWQVTRNGTLTSVYTYDLNGNRLSVTGPGRNETGTYDDQDRLLGYNGATYSYTRAGELQTRIDASGTTQYQYDFLGNLTRVTLPDATVIEYVIDGQNRRIGKKLNGALVQGWLYQDQLEPVAELDGSGNVVTRFVYGTRSTVPDYLIKGGTTYRVIADHLGSVRLVVDATTGVVAQRLDYDEFGRVTLNSAPGFQPFGYAGGLVDNQTGLVRFGARDYDATTGKWLTKDPVGFAGGSANFFAYAYNDPINSEDPDGRLVVHVWNYQGTNVAWGHVSITLDNGTHISWWPSEDTDPGSASIVGIYSATPYPDQLLSDDIRMERRGPDVEISISGLDEAAIQKWWDEYRANSRWRTLSQNCSTTAVLALQAGGAHVPTRLGVWTPEGVRLLARNVQQAFAPQPLIVPDVTRVAPQ